MQYTEDSSFPILLKIRYLKIPGVKVACTNVLIEDGSWINF